MSLANMSLSRSLLCCLCLVLASSACTKRSRPARTAATAAPSAQPGARGLCFAPRHPNLANQPVRAHDWLSLLARLELGRGGVFATRDCLGRWISYSNKPNACETPRTAEPQPRRQPVAEETVVVRDLGDGSYLVWVITHLFDDDGADGYGPIALVHRETDGLVVDALGALRSHRERVKLERWNIQKETVVAASGERCERTQTGQRTCDRTTQLMLQHGQQLVSAPVVDPQGRCLQAGTFELSRVLERPLSSGLTRTFELNADVKHDSRYVVVEERLMVRDTDQSSRSTPARIVQRVETRRLMQPYAGRLVTRQDSLWKRAVGHGAGGAGQPLATQSGARRQ